MPVGLPRSQSPPSAARRPLTTPPQPPETRHPQAAGRKPEPGGEVPSPVATGSLTQNASVWDGLWQRPREEVKFPAQPFGKATVAGGGRAAALGCRSWPGLGAGVHLPPFLLRPPGGIGEGDTGWGLTLALGEASTLAWGIQSFLPTAFLLE